MASAWTQLVGGGHSSVKKWGRGDGSQHRDPDVSYRSLWLTQLAWPAEETSRQVSPKPLSSDSTIPEVAQSEQGSSRVCADGAPWGYTSCSFGPESQNELVLLVLLGVSCLRYTRRATCDIIIPCQRCFHTNIVYYDLRNNINKTFRYRRLI